jgi:hypothetical protein
MNTEGKNQNLRNDNTNPKISQYKHVPFHRNHAKLAIIDPIVQWSDQELLVRKYGARGHCATYHSSNLVFKKNYFTATFCNHEGVL